MPKTVILRCLTHGMWLINWEEFLFALAKDCTIWIKEKS